MNFPISEYISQNVVTTLQGIQLAAEFNGNLSVERFKTAKRNSVNDLCAIVGCGDDEKVADEDTAEGFEYWIRPYWVQVYICEPDSPDMPFDQRADILRADIGRALMNDYQRGGYALNTTLGAPERFSEADDLCGIVIHFDVLYRHTDGNPYEQGPTA